MMLLALVAFLVPQAQDIPDEIAETFAELSASAEEVELSPYQRLERFSEVADPFEPRLRGAIALMEADTDPVVQQYGRALREGQIEIRLADSDIFPSRDQLGAHFGGRDEIYINRKLIGDKRLAGTLVHEAEHAFDKAYDGIAMREARAFRRQSAFSSRWALPAPHRKLRWDRIKNLDEAATYEVVEDAIPYYRKERLAAARRVARIGGEGAEALTRTRGLRKALRVAGPVMMAVDAGVLAYKIAKGESIRDEVIGIASYTAAGFIVAGAIALAGVSAPVLVVAAATLAVGYGIEKGVHALMNWWERRKQSGGGRTGGTRDGIKRKVEQLDGR